MGLDNKKVFHDSVGIAMIIPLQLVVFWVLIEQVLCGLSFMLIGPQENVSLTRCTDNAFVQLSTSAYLYIPPLAFPM